MLKIDIDATLAAIRKAAEASAARPGQDAAELACNRDGIDVVIAFARWRFQHADALPAGEAVSAAGMLIGKLVVASLGAFEEEHESAVAAVILSIIGEQVDRYLSGRRIAGDADIDAVTRDVGDA